ncbi:protein RGF1 INDUCIBLE TRANSCRIPTION FACTOR 1 isoform X1 [Elaeis guineensis]
MGMVEPERDKVRPPWLYPLLRTTFFLPCKHHTNSNKKECNMYCLDCTNGAMCSSCLIYHGGHRSIQIRRSSYHDVIRVAEINKFLDLSGVQTYIINGAKVVFLNERPRPGIGKGVTNTCHHCKRSLLDAFTFCSLGCKLARTSSNATNFNERQMSTESNIGDDSNKQAECSYNDNFPLDCMSPPTPPSTMVTNRMAKRRKGIPHRAPMGVC